MYDEKNVKNEPCNLKYTVTAIIHTFDGYERFHLPMLYFWYRFAPASIPVSILASINKNTPEVARFMMADILKNCDTEIVGSTISDESELIHEIMTSQIDLGHGERRTVGQLLYRPDEGGIETWYALEKCGVARVYGKHGPRTHTESPDNGEAHLFLAYRPIKKTLLKGTDWQDQSIDQILRRIPGSSEGRRRVGGLVQKGILLPWESVMQEYFTIPSDAPESIVRGSDGPGPDSSHNPDQSVTEWLLGG
jgi:hypothetical protein